MHFHGSFKGKVASEMPDTNREKKLVDHQWWTACAACATTHTKTPVDSWHRVPRRHVDTILTTQSLASQVVEPGQRGSIRARKTEADPRVDTKLAKVLRRDGMLTQMQCERWRQTVFSEWSSDKCKVTCRRHFGDAEKRAPRCRRDAK